MDLKFEYKFSTLNDVSGLDRNYLTGTLPTELGHLTSLESLSIYGNVNLTGNIPSTMVNLTSLRTLISIFGFDKVTFFSIALFGL